MLRMVRYPMTSRLDFWLSTRKTQVRTKACGSTSSNSELGGAGKDAHRLSSTWTDPISFDLGLTLLLYTSSQERFSTLLHPMFDQESRQTKSTRSCTMRRSKGMHIRHRWIIGTFQNPSARSFLVFSIFFFLREIHPKISSVNEVICHGIPDKRKLRDGDIVNIGASILLWLRSAISLPRRCQPLLWR